MTPDQIRQRLLAIGRDRATAENRLAEARKKQAKKNEEAASYRTKAMRASSASMSANYLRQAGTAEKAALTEGRKVGEESGKIATLAEKEATLNKDLDAALRRQATAQQREEARRAADAQRAQQRVLAAERRRTQSLVAQTEERLMAAVDSVRPPKVERLRILYLTAADGDLRVGEEMRRVKAGVRASTHRDLIDIDHKPAAMTGDLMDGLLQRQPHVVHFSGHADEQVLEFDTGSDAAGPGRAVTARAFAEALGGVDFPPLLVVLNACKSAAQLEGLLAAVPMAIGMSDSIGDGDAMTFAARFYAALAEGQSVNGAFMAARAQMALDGLPDADLPILAYRPMVVPADVRLVIPPGE